MTIRNLEKYVDSLWDWGFLDRCFKRNIKVTDVDGLVENGGQFLLIEAKSRGVLIKRGQKLAFMALVETGFFEVLIIWGEKNKPEKYLLLKKPSDIFIEPKNCDEAEIRFIVNTWFERAEIERGNFPNH